MQKHVPSLRYYLTLTSGYKIHFTDQELGFTAKRDALKKLLEGQTDTGTGARKMKRPPISGDYFMTLYRSTLQLVGQVSLSHACQ